MTPEQLEKEIGVSAKQQSVLRNNKTFPIKSRKIGRNIYYSIIDIARFLNEGESDEVSVSKKEPAQHKGSKSKNPHDLSHIFLLRSFATNLGTYITSLSGLEDMVSDRLRAVELREDLLMLTNTDQLEVLKKLTYTYPESLSYSFQSFEGWILYASLNTTYVRSIQRATMG